MGVITENVTWADDAGGLTPLNSTNLNNFRKNLFDEFNGNIDNANVKAAAAVDVSKLDFATMDADIAATRANTTTTAISLTCNSLTTGKCLDIVSTTAITTGHLARFYSAGTNTSTRNLVEIINDEGAATGARPLRIQQDANGISLQIASSATSVEVINMTQGAGGPFIDYRGTAAASDTASLSTFTTSGATTHHLQIEINGTKAWIPASTNNPTA